MNENQLVANFRELFATRDPSVLLGSGPDDCAHIRTDGRLVSLSIDALVEDVHFSADAGPEEIAYKSLAASLSDLAASGCRSRWVVVSLGLRKGLPDDWPLRFARGFAEAARRFEVSVVGGDTVSAGAVFVSVTVLGEPWPGGPVLRRGARPGEALVVTGELGGSILGRHLCPAPRSAEMRFLMDFAAGRGMSVSAAMDISDGLAMDLSRMCGESGVGAVVEGGRLPLSEAAGQLAAMVGGEPLDHALFDGEDFELLLALPPELWEELEAFSRSREGIEAMRGLAPFTRAGTFRSERGLVLRDASGGETALEPKGFEHKW